MKCKDCPYYFSNTDNEGRPTESPRCQYRWDDGYAPCEIDDAENETEDIDEE